MISPEALEKARGLVANYGSDPDGLLVGAVAAALQSQAARIAELETVLEDLLSWFPDKPSEPEWRIKAGNYGADAAVSIARSLLNKDRQP